MFLFYLLYTIFYIYLFILENVCFLLGLKVLFILGLTILLATNSLTVR
jgi:hypothetical protein